MCFSVCSEWKQWSLPGFELLARTLWGWNKNKSQCLHLETWAQVVTCSVLHYLALVPNNIQELLGLRGDVPLRRRAYPGWGVWCLQGWRAEGCFLVSCWKRAWCFQQVLPCKINCLSVRRWWATHCPLWGGGSPGFCQEGVDSPLLVINSNFVSYILHNCSWSDIAGWIKASEIKIVIWWVYV